MIDPGIQLQNIKGIISRIWNVVVDTTDERDFVRKYAVGLASDGMIYVQSLMKVSVVIQKILRFRFTNLNVCNVSTSITNQSEVSRGKHMKRHRDTECKMIS